jgi:hypothetical protein
MENPSPLAPVSNVRFAPDKPNSQGSHQSTASAHIDVAKVSFLPESFGSEQKLNSLLQSSRSFMVLSDDPSQDGLADNKPGASGSLAA